jgi:oligogalacturonide lyase
MFAKLPICLIFHLVFLSITNSAAQEAVNSTNMIDTTRKVAAERVSGSLNDNRQLLYFTSTSLLKDDRHLIFLNEESGNPNIFLRDIQTGRERQLSQNRDGFLKSYVYFDGKPYRGFGKASVSVDVKNSLVYYIQGRDIMVADTSGHQRVIARYPEGQMTAFTHVSADGSRLCVPTTDARALDGDKILKGKPDFNIDQRVREENLSSW